MHDELDVMLAAKTGDESCAWRRAQEFGDKARLTTEGFFIK